MVASFRRRFRYQLASNIVIVLNSAVIVFHLLVLIQIIPFDVVWAGRLKSLEEMYVFETVSIAINIILIGVVLRKVKTVRLQKRERVVDVILWFFALLFTLNTLGNLTSATSVEKFIATPLTFLLALCCIRLAIALPFVSTVKENGRS